MLYNFFWLSLGSGMSLLGSLSLSYKMTIENFGVVSALMALAAFFSVVASRGQQAVILASSPHVYQNTLIHSVKRIVPALIFVVVLFLCFYLYGHFQNLDYLVYLLPFVALSVICQIMMGLSQARNSIKIIGFYQALPALARSMPALLLVWFAFISGEQVELLQYFLYVSLVCLIFVFITLIMGCRALLRLEVNEVPAKAKGKEGYFWATSILSSSYASIIAPLILFSWGETAAGVFGVYLMLWGVTNIAISSIFNNYLVPKYAVLRFDARQEIEFFSGTIKYSVVTALVVFFACSLMVEICLVYVWPVEYSNYRFFYYLCIISLSIRPFSARAGIPFNFSNKIKIKTKIQTCSIAFLILAILILAFIRNYTILAGAFVSAELLVFLMYKYYRNTP